jgi:hypothetical protein
LFLICFIRQHLKEGVMKSVIGKSVISATILCFAIGTGAAFAQSPAAPAAPAAPSAATVAPTTVAKTAKPKLSPDEKKKVSQACSAQANDKQLHGKDRRTFRAACIKQGGTST